MEQMRIRDIINSFVPSDNRRKLDDGSILAMLIHNILTTPHPLYEVQDWLKPLDVETLGFRGDELPYIQDDRIGKALANLNKFLFYIVLIRTTPAASTIPSTTFSELVFFTLTR